MPQVNVNLISIVYQFFALLLLQPYFLPPETVEMLVSMTIAELLVFKDIAKLGSLRWKHSKFNHPKVHGS